MMIEYKGYVGVFEYDPDIEGFHGRVVNTRDTITFQGESVDALRRELAASVDDYLAFCAERGEGPDKPFSGTLYVRTSPDVHRAVALAAAKEHKSMNEWSAETLERAARESGS